MKTLIIYLISIITVLLFLTACEDVVQVKLDQGKQLLAVDAFVNDLRQNQNIRLIFSQNYFDNSTTATPVIGAQVVLKDLTANISYTFNYTNNGNYTYSINAGDTIAKLGHAYQLQITYQGIQYVAAAVQKRTAIIDSISSKKTNSDPTKYRCTLWGKDLPGPIHDFYWVKSFKNSVFFGKTNEINVAYDASLGGSGDASANGFMFTPPIAKGITPFGEYFRQNDTCRVEIHAISEECFNFFNQIINNTNNQGLFATTLENAKTNIITPSGSPLKAVGFFNMATVITATKIVQ